jgi:glycerol-3-phosphate acyltransferase PlsY
MFNPLQILLVIVVTPMLAYLLGALIFAVLECEKLKSN